MAFSVSVVSSTETGPLDAARSLALGLARMGTFAPIGAWANQPVTPEGKMIAKDEYAKNLTQWIPSEADRAFVHSLMQRVVEPGRMAGWIAPPERGVNNLPVEHEYVKLH